MSKFDESKVKTTFIRPVNRTMSYEDRIGYVCIYMYITLNWQTLERRRMIKQAMTFYKILNNIIKISPQAFSHDRTTDTIT